MSFDVAKFSQDGLDLLASLSSSKSLRIKNIYVDEDYHQVADLEQTPNWWSNETSTTRLKVKAELSAAGKVGPRARLIVALSLKPAILNPSNVTVKTVVITACGVESGVEGTEITFCGISDVNGVEVLYNASGIKVSTSVSFYFKFNNASSITVESGLLPDYVVHSELDRLMSCHKIGDTTTGDNQEILGDKTFMNTVNINGESGCLIIQDDDYVNIGFIECDKRVHNSGLLHGFWTPNDHYYCTWYDNDMAQELMSLKHSDDYGLPMLTVNGELQIGSGGYVWTDGISEIREHEGVRMCSDFYPSVDNSKLLGKSDKRFSTAYATTFNGQSFTIDSTLTGSFNANITFLGATHTMSLNQDTLAFSYTMSGNPTHTGEISYAWDGNASKLNFKCENMLMMCVSNAYTQINSAYLSIDSNTTIDNDLTVTGNITGNLHGCLSDGYIPYPSSATNIPVGCILVLQGTIEVKRGDKIKPMDNLTQWMIVSSSSALGLYFGELDTSSPSTSLSPSSYQPSTTRFVALSRGAANKPFLAMRIS